MVHALPTAQVVRKYIDETFDAHAPIFVIRWQDASGPGERMWELPEGMCVVGSVPRKFGIRIRRQAADSYAVRLMWEGTQLNWSALSRVELLKSCLSPLLAALAMDLWSLLEQPLAPTYHHRVAA